MATLEESIVARVEAEHAEAVKANIAAEKQFQLLDAEYRAIADKLAIKANELDHANAYLKETRIKLETATREYVKAQLKNK